MILSTLKTWALAALGLLTAALAILLQTVRFSKAKEERDIAKGAQKVSQKASEAMVEGLNKEKKIAEEKIDVKNREGLQ